MSDQISEKMANEIFDANEQFNAAGLCSGRERFISALKHFGLIKPSKLDEARDMHKHFSERSEDGPEFRADGRWVSIQAYNRLAHQYERAITEILEERK